MALSKSRATHSTDSAARLITQALPPALRCVGPSSSGPRHGALHELVEEWDGEGSVAVGRAVDHALGDQRRNGGELPT